MQGTPRSGRHLRNWEKMLCRVGGQAVRWEGSLHVCFHPKVCWDVLTMLGHWISKSNLVCRSNVERQSHTRSSPDCLNLSRTWTQPYMSNWVHTYLSIYIYICVCACVMWTVLSIQLSLQKDLGLMGIGWIPRLKKGFIIIKYRWRDMFYQMQVR